MKLEHIKLNKNYKYKILCELLDETIKTGKSKQLQIKNWERYFNIEKAPKAIFIITEIYDIPKEKVSNRGKSENSHKHSTSEYNKYIDPILINYFQERLTNDNGFKNENRNELYISRNQLAQECGFCNINFKMANRKRYETLNVIYKIDRMAIKYPVISDVINKINETTKTAIPAALNRLSKQDYIKYQYGYVIICNNKCRLANEEEIEIIKKIENKVMQYMGYDNINKLLCSSKASQKYYSDVDKLIKQEIEQCDQIFKGFKINIYMDIMDIQKKSDEDISKLKKELNILFIRKVKDRMVNNQKKVKEKYSMDNFEGSIICTQKMNTWDKSRYNLNYLILSYHIIKRIINLESKDITSWIELEEIDWKE